MATVDDTTDPLLESGDTQESASDASDTDVSKSDETPEQRNRRIEKLMAGKLDSSEEINKLYRSQWKENVERRMGYAIGTYNTGTILDEVEGQSEINPDWSLTKTKVANLYSQVPKVLLTHESEQYAGAIPPFAKALNYEIGKKRARAGVAMEECCNDMVNAAGIGAYIVGYAARFDQVQVPTIDVTGVDPQVVDEGMKLGVVPSQTVPRVVSDKFFWTRIAPTDIRVPREFLGSDFDDADWVGRCGRMSKSDAQHEFKLDEEQLAKLTEHYGYDENLRVEDGERNSMLDSKGVTYEEAYYWRHRFDPSELHLKAIWRIVFVDGLEEAVIHEPWKGQKYDEQSGSYIGSCLFPIRVGTLTYISDNPIPPSDSQAGRPQVLDLRKSRQHVFLQRARSLPQRWHDVNRFNALQLEMFNRGEWQNSIPVNGSGERAMGEIAKASHPSESFEFDRMTSNDLRDVWNLGPNQAGNYSSGETSATEANNVQAGFNTNIGKERDRVAKFFLGGVEVMAGLMVLYSDFKILSEQERMQMQQAWNMKQILHDLVFDIWPDSTVRLDPQVEIDRLLKGLNMTAQSGYVNPKYPITRVWELLGVDPAKVIMDPQPKQPDPVAKFTFNGKDDIINPAVAAILAKEGQLPGPQEVQAAQAFLVACQQPPQVPQPQQGMLPGMGGPPAPPGVPTEPAHPDWHLPDRIAKRERDAGTV